LLAAELERDNGINGLDIDYAQLEAELTTEKESAMKNKLPPEPYATQMNSAAIALLAIYQIASDVIAEGETDDVERIANQMTAIEALSTNAHFFLAGSHLDKKLTEPKPLSFKLIESSASNRPRTAESCVHLSPAPPPLQPASSAPDSTPPYVSSNLIFRISYNNNAFVISGILHACMAPRQTACYKTG
jgi:hypothetical protein